MFYTTWLSHVIFTTVTGKWLRRKTPTCKTTSSTLMRSRNRISIKQLFFLFFLRVPCPLDFLHYFTDESHCDIYRCKNVYLFIYLFCCLFCFSPAHGIQVNATDKGGKLCIYADLMVNFSVSYETTENKVSVFSVITGLGSVMH